MQTPLEAFSTLTEGFALGASLIVAIGAQNAFVLRRGLAKIDVASTALVCSLIDALLITLGVFGLGALIQGNRWLLAAATLFGVIFLSWYAVRSFQAAFRSQTLETPEEHPRKKPYGSWRRRTLVPLLGFSRLNPHVYLDTVILLGAAGVRHAPASRPYFAFGAVSASFVWFFGLAFGAAFLAPLFRRPLTWRVLDFLIGSVMVWIVVLLCLYLRSSFST